MVKFIDNPLDNYLVVRMKREANIELASLEKENDKGLYNERYNYYLNLINILQQFGNIHSDDENEVDNYLNDIIAIIEDGILFPLTLEDNEFEEFNNLKIALNSRYSHIIKTNDNKIYNRNAYKITVKSHYSHPNNSQIEFTNYQVVENPKIYLSKGGVITGEYIKHCEIRQDIVEKHCFTIQSIPNIPTDCIYDNKNHIYVVDHRCPKLKALMEFYNVPIGFDIDIKNKKYNLRNYTKLKK